MEEIIVIGDWIRDRILGQGSFGTVILWKNTKNHDEVATKICRWGDDPQLKTKHKIRWTKEVEMLSQIDSPNIVKSLELPPGFLEALSVHNASKLPILCMEFCGGGDLRRVLCDPDACCGLPEFSVRCILNDIKNAISYLHNIGITHRDLKPENIVLQNSQPYEFSPGMPNKQSTVYKLIDLGYAKELDYKSQCASFVGTLQYLAPELLFNKSYSNSVDYWSFGLLVFEIICGVRPFLPNYSPVQCMNYLESKPSSVICIRENFNGEVELLSHLHEVNHISQIFKGYLEKWLKVALEFNPKKRGHSCDSKTVTFALPNAKDSDGVAEADKFDNLVIFKLLDDILQTKIITIFSVYTLTMKSYEIDDSVLISTINSWIKRDLEIDINDQLLIPRNCAVVKSTDVAARYCDKAFDVVLYLFNIKQLVMNNPKTNIPKDIERCLETNSLDYGFNYMGEIYRNSYNYVITEKAVFEHFAVSTFVLIKYLSGKCKELLCAQNDVDKLILCLNAKVEMLTENLRIDCDKIARLNGVQFCSNYKAWILTNESTLIQISSLMEAWKQLSHRMISIVKRIHELNSEETYKNIVSLTNDVFGKLKVEALLVFADFKRNEKKLRGTTSKCHDAIKIISRCRKLRITLLECLMKKPFVLKSFQIVKEANMISDAIDSFRTKYTHFANQVTGISLNRSNLLWEYLNSFITPQSCLENNIPNTVMSFEENPSLTNRIVDATNSPNYVLSRQDDFGMLISEDNELRNTSNDILKNLVDLKQSYKSMDFDYIDDNND